MTIMWSSRTADVQGLTANRISKRFGLNSEVYTIVVPNMTVCADEIADRPVLSRAFANTNTIYAGIDIHYVVGLALDGDEHIKLQAVSNTVLLLRLTLEAVERHAVLPLS